VREEGSERGGGVGGVGVGLAVSGVGGRLSLEVKGGGGGGGGVGGWGSEREGLGAVGRHAEGIRNDSLRAESVYRDGVSLGWLGRWVVEERSKRGRTERGKSRPTARPGFPKLFPNVFDLTSHVGSCLIFLKSERKNVSRRERTESGPP